MVSSQIQRVKDPSFYQSVQQISMGDTLFLGSHSLSQKGHMVEVRDTWDQFVKS